MMKGQYYNIYSGKISLEIVCQSLNDISSAIFYLCGPFKMIQQFKELLTVDYRISQDNIRIDDWGYLL